MATSKEPTYDEILGQVETLHLMLVDYMPQTERSPSYEELEAENRFLRSLMDSHYSSMVNNMRIKSKKGKSVWIDVQGITITELLELDQDEEVRDLIESNRTARYRDRDY